MHADKNQKHGFQPFGFYQNQASIPVPQCANPKLVLKATINLIQTYARCDPAFAFNPDKIPRRVLTVPSEGVFNDGFDNVNHNYILRINDKLVSMRNQQIKTEYVILEFLGQGTFGQVVKCVDLSSNQLVAIKIIKNQKSYYNQGKSEVRILRRLMDKGADKRIVRLLDCFYFRFHLCLVFELLDVSLLELLYSTEFKGVPLSEIGFYTRQLLEGLIRAHEDKIVHCDIKPENILFAAQFSTELKIIDFGSACLEKKATFSYIQSRHYRSPEVLLGNPYGTPIDMWSLGCVVAEMYLGLPIFPGNSDYDQIRRIVELVGHPTSDMILTGRFSHKFYRFEDQKPIFKTRAEYEASENKTLEDPKTLRKVNVLEDLRDYYSYSMLREQESKKGELENFAIFLDFLRDLLNVNPGKRVTAAKAIKHPFIVNCENFSEKITVKLPFFECEEQELLRSILRKKIKISKNDFDPKNIQFHNVFQANDPEKPEKDDSQRKSIKRNGKKHGFYDKNPAGFYQRPTGFYPPASYLTPNSMNSMAYPYGMLPPQNYQNYANSQQLYQMSLGQNLGIQGNFPAQFNSGFDFYQQFANLQIATPFNQAPERDFPLSYAENTAKRPFLKQSAYSKSKGFSNGEENGDFFVGKTREETEKTQEIGSCKPRETLNKENRRKNQN